MRFPEDGFEEIAYELFAKEIPRIYRGSKGNYFYYDGISSYVKSDSRRKIGLLSAQSMKLSPLSFDKIEDIIHKNPGKKSWLEKHLKLIGKRERTDKLKTPLVLNNL